MPEHANNVCGRDPADPTTLYRIEDLLARGGQATVYLARRWTEPDGAPVTIRVFTAADDSERPVPVQQASWRKGDRVLAHLAQLAVPHICRRVESFDGHPPWDPDRGPTGEPVPIQVLAHVEGVDLRRRLSDDHLRTHPDAPPVNGPAVLYQLAETLRVMAASGPVVHQDVKPSNVILRPDGAITLIDFTSARADTDLSHVVGTPGMFGPEVIGGNTPTRAYDVHGFGAVAYYLITRKNPRRADAGMNIDALLNDRPALRRHLLAPLADNPDERPPTNDLRDWTTALAEIARTADLPDNGVSWALPERPRIASTPSEFIPMSVLDDALRRLGEPVRQAVPLAPVVALVATGGPAGSVAPAPAPAPVYRRGSATPVPPPVPPQRLPSDVAESDDGPAFTLPMARPRPRLRDGLRERLRRGIEVPVVTACCTALLGLVSASSAGPSEYLATLLGFTLVTVIATVATVLTKTFVPPVVAAFGAAPESEWYHRALHLPGAALLAGLAVWYLLRI